MNLGAIACEFRTPFPLNCESSRCALITNESKTHFRSLIRCFHNNYHWFLIKWQLCACTSKIPFQSGSWKIYNEYNTLTCLLLFNLFSEVLSFQSFSKTLHSFLDILNHVNNWTAKQQQQQQKGKQIDIPYQGLNLSQQNRQPMIRPSHIVNYEDFPARVLSLCAKQAQCDSVLCPNFTNWRCVKCRHN